MNETMTWKEYNTKKKEFGLEAVQKFRESWFAISDFRRAFGIIEREKGIKVRSPQNYLSKVTGGWDFTDWRDRSRVFLDALMRKGKLERRLENRRFEYREKDTLKNLLENLRK